MISETLTALISDLKWPVVILITLVLFRSSLREFFGRLSSLNIKAGDFKLETELKGRVSPDVIKEIRNKPGLLQQRNVSREQVTILHLETRGYTVLYEELSAEELSEYLNIYLTKMTDVVFELGGTIDRYEGTALTAHWGSPIHYTDAPSRACRAALQMQSLIKELSPNLVSKGFPPLLPLFVITTADVMVGNFGSEQRANYSILGDYMDILRRLVTLNYNFQTNILITQFTYQYVENEFEVRLLAEKLQTKGKDQPIAVYELCGQIGKPTK